MLEFCGDSRVNMVPMVLIDYHKTRDDKSILYFCQLTFNNFCEPEKMLLYFFVSIGL